MNNSQIRRIILFINFYLLFTVLYFYFGRYNWQIPSNGKLLLFIISVYLFLNLGFLIGFKRSTLTLPTNKIGKNVLKIFNISCIMLIIFQIMWVITILGKFNFLSIISNLGDNYIDRLDSSNSSVVPIMQIRTLLWGMTLFVYPIGFMIFKNMPFSSKFIFLITIVTDVLASLNMGISKNIGDIVLVFLLVSFIKNKKPSKYLIKIVAMIILFLSIFGTIQIIRDNSYGYNSTDNQIRFINSTNRDFSVFDVLSFGNNTVRSVVDRFGFYISHGYAGLAYSLELSHESTFGLGISRALMEYAESYFGLSVQSNTYVERIDSEFGWPNGIYWSTSFVWVASSFTFWLTPLFFLFFGFLFVRVISRFYKYKDIFSLSFAAILFIQLIYLPANAQILQARTSFFGTIFLSVVYLLSSRAVKCNEKFIVL